MSLISITVFVPVPYGFDDCSFLVSSQSGSLTVPSLIFFLKIAFAILGSFCISIQFFLITFSVEITIDNLIGVVLNL